ncbi:hypothetical protein BJ138DRAFT_1115402 [Hygrophoropsis aurantiaca]|uniref:Uncharacterized protein n=1 Tax=Hygrophoropsis aurantiaca TaxID=72124 RepID=A0ACB8A6W9_9AGAM|nr:hypothetical protein BJ138DRAFT_1115402 [Hygrophoropsis aurantiaca]
MTVPVSFAEDLRVRGAFGVAGYTVFIWEHILTFEEEVRYIWQAPWTVSKASFLVSRYGNLVCLTFVRIEEAGLLSHGSEVWCHRFNIFASVYMIVSVESIHILVLMRAWAIWGCTKGVMVSLMSIYVTYLLLLLSITVFGSVQKSFYTFEYLGEIGICVGIVPPRMWTLLVANLVLDTIFLILTMRSLRKYSRVCRHLYPSQLLHQLVKDAFTLFFVGSTWLHDGICTHLDDVPYGELFSVCARDSLQLNRGDPVQNPNNFLSPTFTIPTLSITGQRLVLNLRGLQTRSCATGDLSHEVDRQIMAFEQGPGHASPMERECGEMIDER